MSASAGLRKSRPGHMSQVPTVEVPAVLVAVADPEHSRLGVEKTNRYRRESLRAMLQVIVGYSGRFSLLGKVRVLRPSVPEKMLAVRR